MRLEIPIIKPITANKVVKERELPLLDLRYL
jgi:hypothetical protein